MTRNLTRRQIFFSAVAVPIATGIASAEAPTYRVGLLSPTTGEGDTYSVFVAALANLGYHEKKNLTIIRRFTGGDLGGLLPAARELVAERVDLIVTQSTPATIAAMKATATLPIVMATSGDAVGAGLVASLARPGGNVTGNSFLGTELAVKHLDLLKEILPRARHLAFLGNSQFRPEALFAREMTKSAPALGVTVVFVDQKIARDLDRAFATLAGAHVDGVSVAPNTPNLDQRQRIVTLSALHRLPAIYMHRAFTQAGGLMSYGYDYFELWRKAAVFVDKIFRGVKPGDLPVEQPSRFELVINLKTATALSLTIPQSALLRADEVIE